jgi:hypothetical protein
MSALLMSHISVSTFDTDSNVLGLTDSSGSCARLSILASHPNTKPVPDIAPSAVKPLQPSYSQAPHQGAPEETRLAGPCNLGNEPRARLGRSHTIKSRGGGGPLSIVQRAA